MMSFGQPYETNKQLEENYNELKAKYEIAIATSKDWKEKLQEVVTKQKEKTKKEFQLKEEYDKLVQQNREILLDQQKITV